MKTKQYIKLPQISNQKIRQKYYTPGSVTHPAKADIPMMIWILKKFVQDGDVVLDPMAGIFTTGIEGMRLFPNSLFIGVDLEGKFVKMARANIKKVERIARKDMFMKIGKAVCVQGDARGLERILKEKVGKIITSPPYSRVEAHHDLKFMKETAQDFTEKVKRGKIKGHGFTPEARKRVFEKAEKGKSENPENIGNLQYGQADKIISSPPFQQAGTDTEKRMKKRLDKVFKGRSYVPTQKYQNTENISNIKPYGQVNKIVSSPPFASSFKGSGYEAAQKRIKKGKYKGKRPDVFLSPTNIAAQGFANGCSKDPNNIENLSYGSVNKIISSPPFGGQVQHKTNYLGRQKRESGFEYSDNPENIGNMPHGQIDKVITSPPYSEKNEPFISKSYLIIRQQTGRNTNRPSQKYMPYSQNPNNIGNLKDKTYLGEMLKVYQECFKVLKPGGLMVLITKDFIRNKKRVTLGEDTLKLCQAAGFTFKKIYYRKIEHPSFWRTLYHQKHPEVEKIDCEDILVFEKSLASGEVG